MLGSHRKQSLHFDRPLGDLVGERKALKRSSLRPEVLMPLPVRAL
jgi:hypothetical protein